MKRLFKKNPNKANNKIDSFIKKYNIPREYLSVNRKSISRGLLVGLFWGFIPMPFQMLAVLAITPFFKFNIPLALGTVWLSNPITMPFMYYMEYITGTWMLNLEAHNVELSIQWFENNLGKIFYPLYVGALLYAISISISVYYLVDWLWIHSVKKERRHQKRKDNLKNKLK